jgi:hypothetical protein
LALSRKTSNEPGEQIELLMPDKDVQAWEYAVLVTNPKSGYRDFPRIHAPVVDRFFLGEGIYRIGVK